MDTKKERIFCKIKDLRRIFQRNYYTMRNILILSALLILSTGSKGQPKRTTDLEMMQLRGSVRSIVDSIFRVEDKFGKEVDVFAERSEYIFNKFGFIERATSPYNSHVDSIKNKKFVSGRPTESDSFFSMNYVDFCRAVLVYDSIGNVVSASNYDNRGSVLNKLFYKYSKNGDLETVEKYDGFGEKESLCNYVFSYRNNVKRHLEVHEINYPQSEVTYGIEFDSLGRYAYDDDNEMIITYYNDHGDIRNVNEDHYEYLYDREGNYIDCKKFEQKFGSLTPTVHIKRFIKYNR